MRTPKFVHPSIRRTAVRFTVLVCLGLFTHVGLRGAPVIPVPISSLAQRADVVILGKVTGIETSRDSSGRMATRVEIEVRESWKGDTGRNLSLLLAGGTLGEKRVIVLEQPLYRIKEEVVIFAVREEGGNLVTLELAQGKFLVHRDSPSGPARVCNGVFGSPAQSEKKAGYEFPARRPLTLEELQSQVRRALGSR